MLSTSCDESGHDGGLLWMDNERALHVMVEIPHIMIMMGERFDKDTEYGVDAQQLAEKKKPKLSTKLNQA